MTNREWINNLSVEELDEWLRQEHIEPMPDLQLGDIVISNNGWSYVAISPMTLVGMETRTQYNLEDINNVVTLIQRYDGKVYQTIWRADDDQL